MIIEPKVREYICTTAHPQGCAESVRNQADYACKQGMVNGTKKALIINARFLCQNRLTPIASAAISSSRIALNARP
jgi:trans-2-enoyl-CoA reductase